MGSVAISVRHLVVRRGGKPVLADVSLDIRAGLVTGLLGPSGAGKTTVMRAIVGVQVTAGGDVTVLGERSGSAALRRRVAYVTQAPSVYGDLTVRENLDYFTRVLDADRDRIDQVVGAVGLGGQVEQVARTLSGGERSRCSLAVALLAEPDVLVLDEPTVGLDPVLRRDLWAMFHLLASQGRTVLVSTHVMDEAARCDELVLLRQGRVVATGSPTELRRQADTEDLEAAFLVLATADT